MISTRSLPLGSKDVGRFYPSAVTGSFHGSRLLIYRRWSISRSRRCDRKLFFAANNLSWRRSWTSITCCSISLPASFRHCSYRRWRITSSSSMSPERELHFIPPMRPRRPSWGPARAETPCHAWVTTTGLCFG